MPKFNTLREWIGVLPRIRKYIDIKTYGQWFSSTGYENFCNNIGEKDAKLLDSLVYNIEMKHGDTVVIDTDYIHYYKDRKDDIIASLWEKLYDNDSNSKRMKKLFEDCKAGKATEDNFK